MDYNNSYNGQSREAEFQSLAQNIASSIQKISQNVAYIRRMVNQLNTPQETTQIKNQLREIQDYTSQLAKDTSVKLKELSKMKSSNHGQWKMQKERLTEEFTAALTLFQQAQREAHSKQKETLLREKESLMDPFHNLQGGGPRQDGHLIELQDQSSNHHSQMTTQQLIDEEEQLQQMREREQSVRRLESDMTDLNELFRDVARYVHEQGEMVDSIEHNIEMSQTQVHSAATDLRAASASQSSYRKKKFMCYAIIFIVVSILLAIMIWQLSS